MQRLLSELQGSAESLRSLQERAALPSVSQPGKEKSELAGKEETAASDPSLSFYDPR